jgi:hypothetical protein
MNHLPGRTAIGSPNQAGKDPVVEGRYRLLKETHEYSESVVSTELLRLIIY